LKKLKDDTRDIASVALLAMLALGIIAVIVPYATVAFAFYCVGWVGREMLYKIGIRMR
jgi:hypothetical protein